MLKPMPTHVTTSIRLPGRLRERLEKQAKLQGRSNTWIITRALEDYLKVEEQEELEQEARRQSLLANARTSAVEAASWESGADFEDWK